ncbi:MAG: winged helix-turn-helix domain-containing protein [Syntrophaceae bacterium]|nr:winged helix-turn-helix domain-containing protein [Syntrophaceae bacterium]HQM46367.1 winged helix-turn-helix domain-containing protein [Smithellaceae bacterium]
MINATYRLLARHGWRKIQPGTKHPKRDPVLQDELKKISEEVVAASMKNEESLPLKLMFQDEAVKEISPLSV